MTRILVVDDSPGDVDHLRTTVAREGWELEVYRCGSDAERVIFKDQGGFSAAIILWEIPGPPFGFDLLSRCRQHWPAVPVVVCSGTLDVALAARATLLGAKDFLERPLDSERVRSCLQSLLASRDPLLPLVERLRETILGESPALLDSLRQVARAIPHTESRILLVGETGTGKELFAQAIHRLGPRATEPWVAVNVGEISPTLIESALFGHERGAFTGAADRHIGYLEEARKGTLFLDEIGDLEVSLQGKLLRTVQEKEFRRIGGEKLLPFDARLVSATHRDLVAEVNEKRFRLDLFHRIAEVTVQVPPLRERDGDLDLLLKRFLKAYAGNRQLLIARETLTVLRSYSFPGNVRELKNVVKAAITDCDGDSILPGHLPLRIMQGFLQTGRESRPALGITDKDSLDQQRSDLLKELLGSLPKNWLVLPYREALQPFSRAFDRAYLRLNLERSRYNITRAAAEAGIDTKTFRKRWTDCGLPPLGSQEKDAND